MTTNLVDAITSHVSPEMIGSVGRDTGAPPEEVSRAIKSAAPAIVGGMIRNASSEHGAAELLSTVTQKHEPGEMLGSIFGDRMSSVTATVATASGARPEVASRVLAMVTPIAAGLVGKEAVARRLGPQGIMQLLGSQRRFVVDSPHLPRGFAGVLGAGGLGVAGVEETPAIVEHGRLGRGPVGGAHTHARTRSGGPWAILGAVCAGAVALGLIARCGAKDRIHESRLDMPAITSMPMDDRPRPIVQAPDIPRPPAATPAPAEEPTSKTTTTGADMGGADVAPQSVHFDFASADLGSAEKEDLQKLARSLKDHPESRIELVGHTDSIGESEENRHLALERAVTVKKMLMEDGVESARINVITVGAADPSADNSTAEGRADNRRVDVIRK